MEHEYQHVFLYRHTESVFVSTIYVFGSCFKINASSHLCLRFGGGGGGGGGGGVCVCVLGVGWGEE